MITIGVAAAFCAGFVFMVHNINSKRVAQDATAQGLGFSDHDDLEAAKARGIIDSIAWRTTKETERTAQAKEAEARAERQRLEVEARAKTQRIAEAAIAEMKRSPIERMSISKQSWQKGGFDTIALMSMTISNKNDFAVKDIRISCNFFAKSGTQLNERSHTIFDIIPASSSKSFSKVNVGFIDSQADRGGCDLVGAARN